MAAPTPGAYPFAQIANDILTRLSTQLGLDRAYIHTVANDRYKVAEVEPMFAYVMFLTVGKPRDPGLDFTNAGAGRMFRPAARRMRVYLYTRSGADLYGTDDVALFGADPTQTYETPPVYPGHLVAEEVVFGALDDYLPTVTVEDAQEPMTIGPLHVLDSSEYPQRAPEADEGLIRSCLDFEIVYALCIDPTEPQYTIPE